VPVPRPPFNVMLPPFLSAASLAQLVFIDILGPFPLLLAPVLFSFLTPLPK
jgi:hypothetical protein